MYIYPIDHLTCRLERIIHLLDTMKNVAYQKGSTQEVEDLNHVIIYINNAYNLLQKNKLEKSASISNDLMNSYPDVFSE